MPLSKYDPTAPEQSDEYQVSAMSVLEKMTPKMSSIEDSQLRVPRGKKQINYHSAQEPEEDAIEINQSQNEIIAYCPSGVAAL